MGRLLSHKQTTDGNNYTTAYVYNLSGAMLEETYPSGRVVKNTLDADGDLQQVQSKKANDTFRNYANSFNYTAAGAVSSMRLGNGRWENMTFNSRLQPTQIGLGTSATNTSLLKLDYDYGSTDNNGNIKSQTITVPTVGINQGFTAIQTYTYDSLNRIKDAKEMIGTTQTWKQTFTYDRYGNRRFDQANTTFPTSFANPNITNPTIDTANNRFTTGQGYTYDLSGNLLTDAEGKSFFYDAENKQKEAKNASNQTVGTYFYGGDGKRVKKTANLTGEITIFVYDAGGKMVAEYSTVAPTTPQTSYLTNDHLGSPRIITNEIGQVTSRRDFMPFGEEIYSAQRITNLNYTADNVRQKFTSYERDTETDLDFAQARMYSNKLGRFTNPDNFLNDTYLESPSSWNLYVYVRNNPLKYIDPNGEEIWIMFRETQTITNSDGSTSQRLVVRYVQYKGDKLYDEKGNEYTGDNNYAKKVLNDLNQLKKDDSFVKWKIDSLEKSTHKNTITMTIPQVQSGFNATVGSSKKDAGNGNGTDSTIYYDPDARVNAQGDSRTPRVGLAHELSHAFDNDVGQSEKIIGDSGIETREVRAVQFENRVRAKTGDVTRFSYGGNRLSPRELGEKSNKGGVHRSWSPIEIRRVNPNYQQ